MSKKQREALDTLLRNGPLDIGGDPVQQREVFTRMLTSQPLPDDVILTPARLGGVPVLEISIDGVTAEDTLLWFHGGFYVLGSPRTSAGLASDVARRTRMNVICVDYRLAPEQPYPAALDDALAAYRALVSEPEALDPTRLAVVGESAGAGLAAALLVAAREQALPMPAAGPVLAVRGPDAERDQHDRQGRGRPVVQPRGHRSAGQGLRGRRGPAGSPDQSGVRRSPRPASAADPGGIERTAAR
jgi:acetyl esterase/lipase